MHGLSRRALYTTATGLVVVRLGRVCSCEYAAYRLAGGAPSVCLPVLVSGMVWR
jgi:hypothetical protein